MLHYLTAAIVLLAFSVDPTRAVCGVPATVWRNNNITCPDEAVVCADKFEMTRNWYNGTTCQETRILSNCICSGNQVCPTDRDDHMLYLTPTHKQYICKPKCQVPWCGPRNQHNSPGMGARHGPAIALTMEQNADEFGGRNYYKVNCRCPRHHFPGNTWRDRAVRSYAYRYNEVLGRYYTAYTCNNGGSNGNH